MMTVVFHALLLAPLWEDDETSGVYIRFGGSELGRWKCDHGPMDVKHRYMNIL